MTLDVVPEVFQEEVKSPQLGLMKMCDEIRVTPDSEITEWPCGASRLVIAEFESERQLEAAMTKVISGVNKSWCREITEFRFEKIIFGNFFGIQIFNLFTCIKTITVIDCAWSLRDLAASPSPRIESSYERLAQWKLFRSAHEFVTTIGGMKKIRIEDSQLGVIYRPGCTDFQVSITSVLLASLTDNTEEINLTGNDIFDSHLAFARPLMGKGSPSSLTRVSFSNNSLTDLGLVCLLTGDREYNSVIVDPDRQLFIDLSFNSITLESESVKSILVDALRLNPGVVIDLTGNPIREEVGNSPQLLFTQGSEVRPNPAQSGEGNESSSDSEFVESSSYSEESCSSSDDLSLVSEGSDVLHLLDDQ
jgi:hypothetical protein